MNDINQDLQEVWGKVGFIVHLSQMVEYNLANILSADELLRGFDTDNSMRIVDYNELVQKSNEMRVAFCPCLKKFSSVLVQLSNDALFLSFFI